LLAERDLPGGVVMAPPLIIGDTVVVTLEASHVCAFLAADFRNLWCRNFPGQQMFGHASPSVDAGIVIASGVATPVFLTVDEFRKLSLGLQLKSLRAVLFPRYWSEVWPGQLFTGLELSTGRVVWQSPLFAERRELTGHSSGTAAVENGIGVIVLPLADTVVAFDARTGSILWTSGANEARGPALILDGQVVVAGRNGIIEIRQLADGALRCTITRRVGYDRAGPARAGGLVIFANLEGEVEAIPVGELMSCTAAGARRPPPRK
jgi:outer membrane protein assembly factor BamB